MGERLTRTQNKARPEGKLRRQNPIENRQRTPEDLFHALVQAPSRRAGHLHPQTFVLLCSRALARDARPRAQVGRPRLVFVDVRHRVGRRERRRGSRRERARARRLVHGWNGRQGAGRAERRGGLDEDGHLGLPLSLTLLDHPLRLGERRRGKEDGSEGGRRDRLNRRIR